IMDNENAAPKVQADDFIKKFQLKNTAAMPIFLRGTVLGIFGIGNNLENCVYKKDDLELLDIFAKQVGIALENDFLTHRIERLEIKDPLTGLYNDKFIHTRLKEEIQRAIVYQRPCSYVLLDVDNFEKFHQSFGSLQAEDSLKKISSLLRDSVSEIDRVARAGDNQFAMVLPEKNKRQAQEIAESIRKKIEFSFGEEDDQKKRLTVSGGVSENPLDGVEADELLIKAQESLVLAKQQGKNRIVSFTIKKV
ncbi:diguanylate cyclase, partial [Candidatus Omnitrophota bacterium]